jgi:hypothetical protein
MKDIAILVLSILTAGSSIYGAMQRHRLIGARSELRQAGLEMENLAARTEATELALVEWRDSAHVLRRRAEQLELERDSLDRALAMEARVRAHIEFRFAELLAETSAPVRGDPTDSVRQATFHVAQVCCTVEADVRLPRPPAQASARIRATVRPFAAEAIVGCAEQAGPGGVRSAHLALILPRYITADITVRQEPDVCPHPDPMQPGRPTLLQLPLPTPKELGLVGAGVLAGMVLWEAVR